MTTPPEALREMGADFVYAADALTATMQKLEQGRDARLRVLRCCITDENARLAKMKEERLVYTVLDGKLAAEARFTDKCTGCACDCGDGYPCSHGCGGCHECGYTGKRVVRFAYPVEKHDGSLIEVPK